jgi:DNA-binding HxlR family transcriptional regulator/putative sterol carrier protein
MTDESPLPRSYGQVCGVATALDVIGDRWSVLVIRDLLLGPLRFGDLVDGLPGIGTNTLTARLKLLETTNVVARRAAPLPDRGTVYELTPYGRELEPIVMALGRWGSRSMGRLPTHSVSRSRWLVAAMLAFHDETHEVTRATTWALGLSDGPFTVRAESTQLSITPGAPRQSDTVVTTSDDVLHRVLVGQLKPDEALSDGSLTIDGDAAALKALLALFAFPTLDGATEPRAIPLK